MIIMTDMETMRQWILQYPGWSAGQELLTDALGTQPDCAGLYANGVEDISAWEDVNGNALVQRRYRFTLYRMTEKNCAGWLMGLQNWVSRQNALGLTPAFGNVPSSRRITADGGKWKEIPSAGCRIYSVNLTAEFICRYGEEHGEN